MIIISNKTWIIIRNYPALLVIWWKASFFIIQILQLRKKINICWWLSNFWYFYFQIIDIILIELINITRNIASWEIGKLLLLFLLTQLNSFTSIKRYLFINLRNTFILLDRWQSATCHFIKYLLFIFFKTFIYKRRIVWRTYSYFWMLFLHTKEWYATIILCNNILLRSRSFLVRLYWRILLNKLNILFEMRFSWWLLLKIIFQLLNFSLLRQRNIFKESRLTIYKIRVSWFKRFVSNVAFIVGWNKNLRLLI